VTEIHISVKNLTLFVKFRKLVKKMRTVAAILVILLTMPVSCAMLEVATKKIRLRNRIGL